MVVIASTTQLMVVGGRGGVDSVCLCLMETKHNTSVSRSTRVTRSQSEMGQTIEWEYAGKEKSCNGLQRARKGDFVYDDCKIELPGSPCRFKNDNYFVLVEISNGLMHGYYEYNGEKIPHKRTPSHIRKKNRKRKRFKTPRGKKKAKQKHTEDYDCEDSEVHMPDSPASAAVAPAIPEVSNTPVASP